MAHSLSRKPCQLTRRRAALDDAQRCLARCLDAESRAEAAASAFERRISEQTNSATDLDTSDDDVEAFGRWFRVEWKRLMEARRLLENLQAETTRERAVLNACRLALERCEQRAPECSSPAPHAS